MMTDPLSDFLTRFRNAARGRKDFAEAPWSRLKEEVARVLCAEGYARDVSVSGTGIAKTLRVTLRYDEFRRPVMTGLRRVSRPSLRVYVKSREIPTVRGGLGVNILSTPRGILPDRVARKEKVGGEILCSVW